MPLTPSFNNFVNRHLNKQLTTPQALRAAARPSIRTAFQPLTPAFTSSIRRLSDDTRKSIDAAVGSAPVVLFMKGTPEMPQCGFSRASIQILSLQGVDPSKFAAFNVLEDQGLREGML